MEFEWDYLRTIVFESQKRPVSTALAIMLFSALRNVKGVLSLAKLTSSKLGKKRIIFSQ